MNDSLLFFSEDITPRLRYTIESIVANLLGVSIVFTQDKAAFIASDMPKINYSQQRLSTNELFIQNHALLFENTITPYFFTNDSDFFTNKNASTTADMDFDVFARIFFLLSRYEEYNCPPSVFDAHQRFPSSQSLASKWDFLQEPVVNQYVIELSEKLKARYPNLQMTLPTYRFQPTFDFDRAWLYRNLGFTRSLGGFLKDILKGKFSDAQKRLKILRGPLEDPYFTFDYIQTLHHQYGLSLVVFWLLGDFAKYDKNNSWTNGEFQSLIQRFAAQCTVGIHPSYRSNDAVSILKKEVKRLETIISCTNLRKTSSLPKINNVENTKNTEELVPIFLRESLFPSRQHFLKLRFPETYRRLLEVGIQEDWTMGYADETGFRASIATPFPWFDLEKDETTRLIIHPFQAMDVTLNNYLHLSPEAATERLRRLIYTCKKVGGTFTTLWHNDNLAEMDGWEGWKAVYERLVEDAAAAI
jgi:hypothetical protein